MIIQDNRVLKSIVALVILYGLPNKEGKGQERIDYKNITEVNLFNPMVPNDIAMAVKSVGERVRLLVDEGGLYRIRVKLDPNEDWEKTIFDKTIEADRNHIDVGLFCILDYSISNDGTIEVNELVDQIILEIDRETFTKATTVAESDYYRGYRPEESAAKPIRITDNERIFIAMWHPNNMGATDFKMAKKHAARSGHSMVATVQRLKRSGEQDGADQPATAPESKPEREDKPESKPLDARKVIPELMKALRRTPTFEGLARILGEPDLDVASGIYVFVYVLDEGAPVSVGTRDKKTVLYVRRGVDLLYEEKAESCRNGD